MSCNPHLSVISWFRFISMSILWYSVELSFLVVACFTSICYIRFYVCPECSHPYLCALEFLVKSHAFQCSCHCVIFSRLICFFIGEFFQFWFERLQSWKYCFVLYSFLPLTILCVTALKILPGSLICLEIFTCYIFVTLNESYKAICGSRLDFSRKLL